MTRCSLVTSTCVLAFLALLGTSHSAFAQGKKNPSPTYYVITDSSSPPQQIGVAVDLLPTTKILTTFEGEDVVVSVDRNGILNGGEIFYFGGTCTGTPVVYIDPTVLARELPIFGQAFVAGDPVPTIIQATVVWTRLQPATGVCDVNVGPPIGPDVFYASQVPIAVNWTFPLQLVRK